MSINPNATHAAPLICSDSLQISGSSGVGNLMNDKENIQRQNEICTASTNRLLKVLGLLVIDLSFSHLHLLTSSKDLARHCLSTSHYFHGSEQFIMNKQFIYLFIYL